MAIQLEFLLIESVSLVRSLEEGDLDEARFRASQVGNLAWADNNAALGNAALNLEAALRDSKSASIGVYEDLLAYLIAELNQTLKPLRGH